MPYPKTRERSEKLGSAATNALFFDSGRQLASRIRRNQTAPLRVLEALEAAATLDFDTGCRREREIAAECLDSDQGRALIHAFLAERGVSKIPDIGKDTRILEIRTAGIVGAGTMGAGIATALVNAGIPVRMRDVEQEALERGIAIVHKNLERSVEKGRSTRAEADRKLAMVQPQSSYEGFDKVDLVIEAVFEDMALKKQVFAEIDSVARSGCVLGSNTSTLDIDALAAETSRPESVVGLHFFSPAHVMRLLEIVRAARTSKSVLATALSLARTLRKVGVVVGNCRGFVGNRMMLPYMREAQFLVEEGATPTEVDRALFDFGMAMGIFAVDDMGGLDVQWRVRRESRGLEKPGARGPLVLDKLYAMGRLGQKTGSGWHRYEGGDRTPHPDPEVEALIEATAREAGIRRRSIGPEEIVERCIDVMINEAARILDEGHALRAGDIDTIYLTGYGFPSYRGGPMWYADTVGLDRVHARIEACRDVHGEAWEPAPLLTRLVAEGRSFADYDAVRTGSP